MSSGQNDPRPCGHSDDGDFCFGPSEPDFLAAIPEEQRQGRVLADSDLCIVDDRHFFIRGMLELPILGTTKSFTWLVWVSLSEENLNRAADLWETPGREREPPYFGWLNTRLPGYPDTLEIKVHVHTLQVGRRPSIEVERNDHPLSQDQSRGITMARANLLAKQVMLEWS
jgi:hypothetical protein